jgi:hypothetical protein
MLPAFALSTDHGAAVHRQRKPPAVMPHARDTADQEMVGATLCRAAISLAVEESGPGGATKIASR